MPANAGGRGNPVIWVGVGFSLSNYSISCYAFVIMSFYPLRYLPTGHVFIDPEDDCDKVVDSLLAANYDEEFCLARDFEEDFISRLMEAGFLIMSTELKDDGSEEKNEKNSSGSGFHKPSERKQESGYPSDSGYPEDSFFILLPKLHLKRSALFFPELHIKRSIRPFLSRYELRVDTDFDFILDKCIHIHGADWLTPPLVEILKNMRRRADLRTKPVSFGVYRDGELKAGEIGVAVGRVYTSYSGYYEEDNAGTVQMILMAGWLEEKGFDFLDLGMPLDYKTFLGARDITPGSFVGLFRAGRR